MLLCEKKHNRIRFLIFAYANIRKGRRMPVIPIEEINLLHNNICQAVNDPKRIQILYALSDHPLNVTALATLLDTPQPTISRHLSILRQRALVDNGARRDHRRVQAGASPADRSAGFDARRFCANHWSANRRSPGSINHTRIGNYEKLQIHLGGGPDRHRPDHHYPRLAGDFGRSRNRRRSLVVCAEDQEHTAHADLLKGPFASGQRRHRRCAWTVTPTPPRK